VPIVLVGKVRTLGGQMRPSESPGPCSPIDHGPFSRRSTVGLDVNARARHPVPCPPARRRTSIGVLWATALFDELCEATICGHLPHGRVLACARSRRYCRSRMRILQYRLSCALTWSFQIREPHTISLPSLDLSAERLLSLAEYFTFLNGIGVVASCCASCIPQR